MKTKPIQMQFTYQFVVKKNTNRQIYKQTNRQIDKQTNRKTDKQTNRQTDKQKNRQAEKQTNRQKHIPICYKNTKLVLVLKRYCF